MATIKSIHSRSSIGNATRYITQEEKTDGTKISGIDCDPFQAADQMNTTRELYGKTSGRTYDHYVFSFAAQENVTFDQAHELAREWAAKEFPGHEMLLATHNDTLKYNEAGELRSGQIYNGEKLYDIHGKPVPAKEMAKIEVGDRVPGTIHTHIIVNSVNYETGKKLHTNIQWLAAAKGRCNKLCQEHGLSVNEKGKTFEGEQRTDMTTWSKEKWQLLQRANQKEVKSYVLDTSLDVARAAQTATSKDDFVRKLNEKGYDVKWTDTRKNVTFKNQETGKSVRLSNIEKTFCMDSMTKEGLLNEFTKNAERAERAERNNAIRERAAGTGAGHSGRTQPGELTANRAKQDAAINNTDARIEQLKIDKTERRIADIKREREAANRAKQAAEKQRREIERKTIEYERER